MTRAERWIELQRQAAGAPARLRDDNARVRREKGEYAVLVKGFGLHNALSPPSLTVGGVPAEDLRFQPDGLALHGVLRLMPTDERTVLEYGFTRIKFPPK